MFAPVNAQRVVGKSVSNKSVYYGTDSDFSQQYVYIVEKQYRQAFINHKVLLMAGTPNIS